MKILLYVGSFLIGACVNALYVIQFSILTLEVSNAPETFTTHNLVTCFGFALSSLVWLATIG
jgi:hypothetical protein